jgi:hypothetical protein
MKWGGHCKGRRPRHPQDADLGSRFSKKEISNNEQGISNDEVFFWVSAAVFMLAAKIEAS